MTPSLIVERYIPTSDQRANLKMVSDRIILSGDGIFATVQGEGLPVKLGGSQGKGAVFCRTAFCNRECDWCDIRVSWDTDLQEFWEQSYSVSASMLAWQINQLWNSTDWAALAKLPGTAVDENERRVVFTGGEPTLQKNQIALVITELPGYKSELETNGTISPYPQLEGVQVNCSPKLRSSHPNRNGQLFSPSVLRDINERPSSIFKFVVSDLIELDEVRQIVSGCGLSGEKIVIMSEGVETEELEHKRLLLSERVKDLGWKEGTRLHINLFGNKRRT